MFSLLLRTLLVYIFVIAAMRLMGKRQLGELQPSELVTTFLISNVASLCLDEPDLPLLYSLVPILLLTALEILNSTAVFYFPRYEQLLSGRPVTVIQDGKIDQRALRFLRITPNDLAQALRSLQVDSPESLLWGVVEPNGKISIVPQSADKDAPPMLPLLVDRHIFEDNLALFGLDRNWLDAKLQERGLHPENVLLFLYNGSKILCIENVARRPKS